MRPPLLAALVAIGFALGFVPVPGAGAAPVQITISSPTAKAGQPEVFAITRQSGGQGVYVLFQTADGTAKAGVDYAATSKLIYLKGGVTTASVSVPTFVNPSAASSVTFGAAASAGGTATHTSAVIIEPTLPPPTNNPCFDFSGKNGPFVVPGSNCPARMCPGISVPIDVSQPCPPPGTAWISATLHDGGFARVKANASAFDMTGPGHGRALVVGEYVALFWVGWGSAFESPTYAILALSDGSSGRALATDLEGVAPSSGLPPQGLPADWFVPGLARAVKNCPNAFDSSQPGVSAGGIYRAYMVIGSHPSSLAPGLTGAADTVWNIVPADDLNFQPRTAVAGDCLTGN